jgi:hypothetical protein
MSKNSNTPIKSIAAGLAVAALALGGYAVGHSGSSGSTATAATQPGAVGQGVPGGRPGFGTPATGADATKAKAAALAKYPGTVESVAKLPNGNYIVHVLTSNGGEQHVAVSKDFKVSGTQQFGPRGAGGAGATPPATTSSQ